MPPHVDGPAREHRQDKAAGGELIGTRTSDRLGAAMYPPSEVTMSCPTASLRQDRTGPADRALLTWLACRLPPNGPACLRPRVPEEEDREVRAPRAGRLSRGPRWHVARKTTERAIPGHPSAGR